MITKKQIIEIADVLKSLPVSNIQHVDVIRAEDVVAAFTDYLSAQNPNFKRERFIAYVNGECGPNGGRV